MVEEMRHAKPFKKKKKKYVCIRFKCALNPLSRHLYNVIITIVAY